ncbi:hypothetical protein [Actinospica robiniae]|uniref:hypothetical protein n=1 Tax=Actinospica robiniae TaxID=304901 RepID=UPI0004105692|nr:hypothetical protein [Actinospica robiniae]
MGIDYSFEIFVPAGNVARALTLLAELAPQCDRDRLPLRVDLPGGERLSLPFTSGFEHRPIDASSADVLDLETWIMFGADDAVREHRNPAAEIDELGRVEVGYIYLTVTFARARHARFASLDFTAAATSMSLMFQQSESVRKTFTDLTVASGGVCCLLDTQTEVHDICWLNGEPMRETVPGPRFVGFHDLVAAWPDPPG